MERITTEQRRARLGARHGLATPFASVEEAAQRLVGLHASDPATVFLAARARVEGFAPEALEEALYDEKSLVRVLGMRRTMFVTTRELAAVMEAACTRALVPAQRKRLVRLIEDQGVAGDGDRWLTGVEAATMQALRAAGEATAAELVDAVPELAVKLRFGEGKSWAGTIGMSTRVLFFLATAGRIVRGRPRGSWPSSRYRWAPTDLWLGESLPGRDPATARRELVVHWLRSFGPGTLTDLKWWSGWNLGATRSALAAAGAVEVELDEGSGYVLDGDETGEAPPPWVALLPALDPTIMGWKERDWYLGAHAPRLFDRNGNAGPTAWVDGRVVGGWAQRSDGSVAVELLEDPGRAATAALHEAAERLREWLGSTRVIPRFRTPLDRELAG
jgi:hypothetical protein